MCQGECAKPIQPQEIVRTEVLSRIVEDCGRLVGRSSELVLVQFKLELRLRPSFGSLHRNPNFEDWKLIGCDAPLIQPLDT